MSSIFSDSLGPISAKNLLKPSAISVGSVNFLSSNSSSFIIAFSDLRPVTSLMISQVLRELPSQAVKDQRCRDLSYCIYKKPLHSATSSIGHFQKCNKNKLSPHLTQLKEKHFNQSTEHVTWTKMTERLQDGKRNHKLVCRNGTY